MQSYNKETNEILEDLWSVSHVKPERFSAPKATRILKRIQSLLLVYCVEGPRFKPTTLGCIRHYFLFVALAVGNLHTTLSEHKKKGKVIQGYRDILLEIRVTEKILRKAARVRPGIRSVV